MRRFKISIKNNGGHDDGFLFLAETFNEALQVAKTNCATVVKLTNDNSYKYDVIEFKEGEGPSEHSSQFMQEDEEDEENDEDEV